MPSTEFKFYLLLPFLLLMAWLWPRLGGSFFRRVESMFSRLALHPWRSVIAVGLTSFVLGVVPALIRMPAVKVHDEFCYLLTADTFAHGRVTNPTPPLWEHFESMNTIQRPTYNAKYPPAQGAVLAVGQVLWRPILGVWLCLAVAAGAVCWMLQAWLPPRWALLGGFCAALHPQVLAWGYNYWGGAVAMLGGALVCGGLRRMVDQRGGAWACGAGLVVLANSRPYEGFVLSALFFGACLWQVLRRHRDRLAAIVARSILPLSICALLVAATVGYYNFRVTGHALRMPYVEHRDQYAVVPLFAWQKIRPEPEYRHEEIRQMYQEEVDLTWGRKGFLHSFKMKLLAQIQGWWWLGLCMPPLAALPWAWRRDAWLRAALCCLGGFLLTLLTSQGVFAHYAAPGAALFFFAIVTGVRQLRLWQRSRGTGRAFVRGLALLCLVTVPVVWARLIDKSAEGWFRDRERIVAQLESTPGKHLVIVRYAPGHNPNREWVYNGADLESSKVLWARAMSPDRDRELLTRFPDRTPWYLDADTPAPHPVPIESDSK